MKCLAVAFIMIWGVGRTASASLRPCFVSLRRQTAHEPFIGGPTAPSFGAPRRGWPTCVPARSPPFYGYAPRPQTRLCTATPPSADACTDNVPNKTEDAEPFTWSRLIDLFRSGKHRERNYIPSDDRNLALFRRSMSAQASYEQHKQYLDNCWRSAYDYLVVSKFGPDFGFETELCKREGDGILIHNIEDDNSERKGRIPPQGYVYHANPSLAQASQHTIENGITYLKLVPNDFPYDVDAGIEHWCLWKIGARKNAEGEGILMEELAWALSGLENVEADEKSGVGCIIDENGQRTSFGCPEPHQPARVHDAFYWVNPPSLQSMPEIQHAHILVQRADSIEESKSPCPPPI